MMSERRRPPPVIAHRGACGHAPENTLAAFRKAAGLGIGWVEFDTQLSADGTVVVFHDERLERTSDGHGMVEETDWEVLGGLDAGGWFAEAFRGEPIPTLGQVLGVLEELGLGAVVDIKPTLAPAAETGRAVAEILRREWPESLPIPLLSSFNEAALAAAAGVAPELPRALVVRRVPADWPARLERLGCVALHCRHQLLTRRTAKAVTGAGYALRCFVVDRPQRAATLYRWGVAGVFSDFPDRIVPSPDDRPST